MCSVLGQDSRDQCSPLVLDRGTRRKTAAYYRVGSVGTRRNIRLSCVPLKPPPRSTLAGTQVSLTALGCDDGRAAERQAPRAPTHLLNCGRQVKLLKTVGGCQGLCVPAQHPKGRVEATAVTRSAARVRAYCARLLTLLRRAPRPFGTDLSRTDCKRLLGPLGKTFERGDWL